MYLEHFQLKQAPFRQEPDPEIFFPGAGRRVVLNSLLEDIAAGKPLVKLTGSEGVGKTLLYMLLARKLSTEQYDLVCLDHPVGSFEDLLRIICLALNLENINDTEQRDYVSEFSQYLKVQQESHRKVLLIIDEAEKLFLATLERLVRMICDTDEAGVLQILIIGRLDLDPNLDQLSIYCSNIDINAGYIVEPLTFEETQKYLQFRLHFAGIPGDGHLHVFSDDAVAAIHQVAMGNISLTNMLAEKGLVDAYTHGMSQVEPESIDPQFGDEKSSLLKFTHYGDLFREYKKWFISGAALLLILFLVAVWSDSDREGKLPASVTENQTVFEDISVEEEITESVEERVDIEEPVTQAVQEESLDTGPVEGTAVEASEPEPKPLAQVTPEPEKETVGAVVVQAESRKKKSETVAVLPEDKPEPITPKQIGPVKDGEALFKERLKASSNWLAWAYRGGYTIQLMVLASENAEENLKKMLVEERYFVEKDNLYILRKTSPPTLFVFYGLYDSIAEARQVRNKMPVFLRKHHPYALSITAALKKTED